MRNCEEVKLVLYEYLRDELDETGRKEIEEHLTSCPSCRDELQEIKGTMSILDTYTPPQLSEGFEEKLLKRMEEKHPGVFIEHTMPKEAISPGRKRFFTTSLAFAAGVVLVIMAYQHYMPGEDEKGIKGNQKVEITLADAKNPIIVEAQDAEQGFEKLKTLVTSKEGSVLRVLHTDKGFKITVSMQKEKEESFFTELQGVGKVQKKGDYRDEMGNMVIMMKKIEKESPP